jgi:hypothetical protein
MRPPPGAHRPQAAALAPGGHNIRDDQAQNAKQELLAAERNAALREAFTSLPPRYRQLITLLIHAQPDQAPACALPPGVAAVRQTTFADPDGNEFDLVT